MFSFSESAYKMSTMELTPNPKQQIDTHSCPFSWPMTPSQLPSVPELKGSASTSPGFLLCSSVAPGSSPPPSENATLLGKASGQLV